MSTGSVAVAQRRLLESIARYQSDAGSPDQQKLQMVIAHRVLVVAAEAVAIDAGVADIYSALSELISSVAVEQLAPEVV